MDQVLFTGKVTNFELVISQLELFVTKKYLLDVKLVVSDVENAFLETYVICYHQIMEI